MDDQRKAIDIGGRLSQTKPMSTAPNPHETEPNVTKRDVLRTDDVAFQLGCSMEKARGLMRNGNIRRLPGFDHSFRTTQAHLDEYLAGAV